MAIQQTQAPEAQCEVHKTPMISELQHTGDGNTKWSKPFCPLCEEQKAAKDAAPAEKPAPAPAAQSPKAPTAA